jgi:biofilm PGA synthesis N-glycosyltransferase PgaC
MLSPVFLGLLVGSVLLYGLFILRCLVAWRKIPEQSLPAGFVPSTLVSILVPVRNEEANILHLLQDLAALRYPVSLFEVIVADDHSCDGTGKLVQDFAASSPYRLRYLDLRPFPERQGKKAALQAAVELARGEWIACTDGDCRVQPDWLALVAQRAESGTTRFISGPVCFFPPDSLFAKIQQVEFAALIGVGAGSIYLKRPNMCNGANVAFRKESFGEVGGYAGNQQVASGDDEFLMHKIFTRHPDGVEFLKAKGAVVYTPAKKTARSFLSQRVRWASKWPHYKRADVQGVAFLVFWVNLLLFLGAPFALPGLLSPAVFSLALGSKIAVDCVFLYQALRFFDRRHLLAYALPLQLIYIPYVVVTALAALSGTYEWKGRRVR